MGRASATNNGLSWQYLARPAPHLEHKYGTSWVDSLYPVVEHLRTVEGREAYPTLAFLAPAVDDDSHWTVQLTEAERAQAWREARREVGLERCEWRREVVGWTNGRRLVTDTCPVSWVSSGGLDDLQALECHEEEDIARPIYGMVEHWVPAD